MSGAREPSRALVIAGGDFAPELLAGIATDGARVVCVDRGLAHCLAAGLEPALLVGDLDSVPASLLARSELGRLPRLEFPREKDASDLALALEHLAETAEVPEEVVVVGVSGGRTDHLLFNWLLPAARDWPFALRLVDATVDAVTVTASRPHVGRERPGDTLSLLPLGEVRGVSTGGLRYALAGATLAPGTTLGLSNVVAAPEVTVRVESGVLLVLRERDDAGGTDGPGERASMRHPDGRRGERAG